jgi:hypothetical protein
MKILLYTSALSGLALTIIPPVLFFAGAIDLAWSHRVMTVGMILWFAGDIPRVFDWRRPR